MTGSLTKDITTKNSYYSWWENNEKTNLSTVPPWLNYLFKIGPCSVISSTVKSVKSV